MSLKHARFTPSAIEKLKTFYNPRITVQCAHFAESITKHPHTFLYLDPPYLNVSALYGQKGSTHKHFDHYLLCHMLRQRGNRILSYNDCPEIRELYEGYTMIQPNRKYSFLKNKDANELLIFSHDLVPHEAICA